MSLEKQVEDLTRVVNLLIKNNRSVPQLNAIGSTVLQSSLIPIHQGNQLNNISISALKNLINENNIDNGLGYISGVFYWLEGLIGKTYFFKYKIEGLEYTSHDEIIILEPAHDTLDRIDIVYVDEFGLKKVTGTPDSNPTAPFMPNPSVNVLVEVVGVQATSSAPNNVTLINVYKENQGEPNEYAITITTNQVGGIVSDNTINPISTTDIKTIDVRNGDIILFSGSDIDLSDMNNLRLKIKALSNWESDTVRVTLKKDGTYIANKEINGSMLNSTDITEILLFAENSLTGVFNQIEFKLQGGNAHVPLTGEMFQMDDIVIQTGSAVVTPTGKIGVNELKPELKTTTNLGNITGATVLDFAECLTIKAVMTADTQFSISNYIENRVTYLLLTGEHSFSCPVIGDGLDYYVEQESLSGYDGTKNNLISFFPVIVTGGQDIIMTSLIKTV